MELYSLMHLIWTISLFVIFIGIAGWAWSGAQRHRFEKAARAPLDDGEVIPPAKAVSAAASGSTAAKNDTAFAVIEGERGTRRLRALGRRVWLIS